MNHPKINLYIDNNGWDVFFAHQIDLLMELPEHEFNLLITPEVKIEIKYMPKDKLEYVNSILQGKRVDLDQYFGFAEDPRAGGFGSVTDPKVGGRFISVPEQEFIKSEEPKKAMRPTGLRKDETDTYLAARSLHSAVLTCNIKSSIKRAKNSHEGIVIDLKKYKKGEPLADFIKRELQNINYKIS